MSPLRRRVIAVAVAALALGAGLGLQVTPDEGALGALGLVATLIAAIVLTALLVGGSWTVPAAPAGDTAWLEFQRELRRARRHDRPLTLVRVPLTEAEVDATTAARQVGDQLRLIDRTWVDGDNVFVMLPESGRAAARPVIERMSEVAPGPAIASIRVASFPEDGLTSGSLMSALFDTSSEAIPIPIRAARDDSADTGHLEDGLAVGDARSR